MPNRVLQPGSDRLILFIKAAYWIALLLIAGMALASFLLLKQMMADQQREQTVLSLVATQRTLSQRIVFLGKAARDAPLAEKPALVAALKSAAAEFETNYDRLLAGLEPSADSAMDKQDGTVENILYGAPHHLDFFSANLVSTGSRLAAQIESGLTGTAAVASDYRGSADPIAVDAKVANAALEGYSALRDHLALTSKTRLDGMLALHRNLFFATMGLIVLVALFIFRPMAEAIRRRTHELVDARNAMAFLAVHDSLTGLHNRAFLSSHFSTILKSAERRGDRLAVIQFDLDRFKAINDTMGHAAGDATLRAAAARLRESCRAADLCVRLGGDEFVLVLSGAGESEELERLAGRAVARLGEPIPFEGVAIQTGASAGIAVFPLDGTEAADLLTHADLALYSAKKRGGNAAAFFSGELRRELEHRRLLEADMRQALALGSFEAWFQPQVSLLTGAVTGIEALMRWRHPERGAVPPAEFIPVAEKCGLMAEIGRLVFAKAVAQAAEWHRAGLFFGRLAVNASGAELQEPGFNDFLFHLLEKAALPPSKLSLEIVESVILDDEKTGIAAKLRAIRTAGISLELDDFGTGYASLAHINPREIDRLKIDRRFVQNIDANGDNARIVRAVTELAGGLGIGVIAEGAETAAELDALARLGCGEVQGYAVAFPMPPEAAGDWLRLRAAGAVPALRLSA